MPAFLICTACIGYGVEVRSPGVGRCHDCGQLVALKEEYYKGLELHRKNIDNFIDKLGKVTPR